VKHWALVGAKCHHKFVKITEPLPRSIIAVSSPPTETPKVQAMFIIRKDFLEVSIVSCF
jgi:hypothetical protein